MFSVQNVYLPIPSFSGVIPMTAVKKRFCGNSFHKTSFHYFPEFYYTEKNAFHQSFSTFFTKNSQNLSSFIFEVSDNTGYTVYLYIRNISEPDLSVPRNVPDALKYTIPIQSRQSMTAQTNSPRKILPQTPSAKTSSDDPS